MILAQIGEYLAERKRAALVDLSHHFRADPEALRGMLSLLERKGRVRRLPTGTPCGGGCSKCDPDTLEVFEWVG